MKKLAIPLLFIVVLLTTCKYRYDHMRMTTSRNAETQYSDQCSGLPGFNCFIACQSIRIQCASSNMCFTQRETHCVTNALGACTARCNAKCTWPINGSCD